MNARLMFCLALPALALLDGSADPRFAPAKGLRVAKQIDAESQLVLEDWKCVMNGNEVPPEYLPELVVENQSERHISVVDEFVESHDGRALKLRRSYDALAATDVHVITLNGQPLAGDGEQVGKCALIGCSVLFDESATGDARRKLERGECERGVLDKLWVDLDLTSFLPPEGAKESWTVAASVVNPFSIDIGGIAFEFEKLADDDHFDLEQLEKNAEGHWTIARGETREENGTQLLTLPLEGTFTTNCARVAELEHVPNITGEASEKTEEKLEAKGELVWDLTRNCLHSASIEHTVVMTFTITRLHDGAPDEPTYEQTMNFKGTAKVAIAVKVAE